MDNPSRANQSISCSDIIKSPINLIDYLQIFLSLILAVIVEVLLAHVYLLNDLPVEADIACSGIQQKPSMIGKA